MGAVAGRAGIALVGDAAAASDPSWGSGLSKTLIDVESLSRRLAETDDWEAAVLRYAADHDDYYGKLHNILSWMTEVSGPAAPPRTNAAPASSRGCTPIRRASQTRSDRGRSARATSGRAACCSARKR